MNLYKIIYRRKDGTKGEVIVCAVNRLMAFEVFRDLAPDDVVGADCFRVLDDEEKE